ncbi:MAG TPA: hypothetical protein PKE26_11105 [Kiritimatiellia bacterium]|nr:hypothetical protein [Kiritimatiellia bacterium]HMO99647.1 hypothetical protein [Kiritimatiellia bacterium]
MTKTQHSTSTEGGVEVLPPAVEPKAFMQVLVSALVMSDKVERDMIDQVNAQTMLGMIYDRIARPR